MVLMFSISGLLLLSLIYSVLRFQAAQKEIKILKYQVKSLDAHSRFSLSALLLLSAQLQRIYIARLENLQAHALIHPDDFAIAKFIISQVEFIIVECCEKHATVEEALNKTFEKAGYNMAQINKYIAKQPSEVRIPWCQNTVGGFISACYNLTSDNVRTKETEELQSA